MDCPRENGAFTDRTGTTSSMTSQAAALRQAEPASADESTVANAAMAMDAPLREELAELIEAEAELALDVQTTQPAPQTVGDTDELNESVQDEGPLDVLEQVDNNADDLDGGIPPEFLEAPVNPAAATGGKPSEKSDNPVAKKPVDDPGKVDPPVPDGKPADVKAAEAAATGATTDPDAVPEDTDAIDTAGMTPEEILAAAAANADANGDGVVADTAAGDATATDAVDMGAGTAMTADMCPMEAAEMMAGETTTGMADMAADMMSEMADMTSEDMTADDM